MTNPGIQPLSGIKGFVKSDAFATPEQRHGGTADPAHAATGEAAAPYPWEEFPGEGHGPYGLENDLLGVDVCSYATSAGRLGEDPTADLQPLTHAASWPQGVVQSTNGDEVYQRRAESAAIHAVNAGGSREALYEPTLNAAQNEWELIYEVDPGVTFPEMVPLPAQLATGGSAGWGSRDRVQSLARQNGFGFDSAHMYRRIAHAPIPGNYMWMEPGGRPLVKSIPGAAIVPNGPDSPFAGQDPTVGYDSQGSVLTNLPPAYQPPATPALSNDPANYGDGTAVVDLW